MVSGQQKMHATAQGQLVQMSDVKQKLHKKQKRSPQEHPSVQERQNLLEENHKKPQMRCRQNYLKKKYTQKLKRAVGESNHLLILADSAELLESEKNLHHSEMNNQSCKGEGHMEMSMEFMQRNAYPEPEENELHLQRNAHAEPEENELHGKLRLTQIRRLARIKDQNLREERHESYKLEHTYERRTKVKGKSKWMEPETRQGCFSESGEMNDELHLPSKEKHVISQQPELRSSIPGEQEVAHQLTLLRTEKRSDPLQNQCVGALLCDQVHAPVKDQIQVTATEAQMTPRSEMKLDPHSIARQKRMLRIFERRKHRAFEQMKHMYEAERQYLWNTMNVQNGNIHAANQQWLFYISNLQWQQHCVATQLRRASQTAFYHLYGYQLRKHFEEAPSQNADTSVEPEENQCMEKLHEQVTANVEVKGQPSHVKLRKIKCEARMMHTRAVDRNHELQLERQANCERRVDLKSQNQFHDNMWSKRKCKMQRLVAMGSHVLSHYHSDEFMFWMHTRSINRMLHGVVG